MSDCSNCSSGSCENGTCDRLPPDMLNKYNIDQDAATGMLVFVEIIDNKISEKTLKVLTKARQLTDTRVYGIMFCGSDGKQFYDELFSYGVDTLYHMRNADTTFHPFVYSENIVKIAERMKPTTILFANSDVGNKLASIVSSMFDTNAHLDMKEIKMKGRKIDSGIDITINKVSFPEIATLDISIEAIKENRKGTAITMYYSL